MGGKIDMFEKITKFLEFSIQPIAEKMSKNIMIQSITEGMLGIITINIGVSLVSILVNLPIEPWINFLSNYGILSPANELIAATTSLLALYIVISISYSYAKNHEDKNPKAAILIATAVFIIMMPQTIDVGEETISAFQTEYFGSNGMFVAILVALSVSSFYRYLIKKNIKLKMPEQVPTMVIDAMTPIFAAIIIFGTVFIIKYGLSLTQYGDIFNLIYNILTVPAMAFGSSGWTPILWLVLRSFFWFFGIHPSPLNALFFPISAAVVSLNVEAFLAGQPLPHLDFAIMTSFGIIGGTGSTFALSLNMLKAKAERYKALNKIAFIPSVFNINEPYVFGVPLMYNPVMLIPMVLSPIIGGLVGYVFLGLNLINSSNFNPSVTVAWVIPYPIAAFLRGGVPFAGAVLVAIVLQYFLYKPFFAVIDKKAYEEEQESLNE